MPKSLGGLPQSTGVAKDNDGMGKATPRQQNSPPKRCPVESGSNQPMPKSAWHCVIGNNVTPQNNKMYNSCSAKHGSGEAGRAAIWLLVGPYLDIPAYDHPENFPTSPGKTEIADSPRNVPDVASGT
jgi:hypothetical protein